MEELLQTVSPANISEPEVTDQNAFDCIEFFMLNRLSMMTFLKGFINE